MPNTPEHSDDLGILCDRFTRRAQSIATLLACRLETTRSAFDLSEKRLWAAHRDMTELHRHGGAPTPTDYWEHSAHPQAKLFLSEMVQVIAAEQEELMRAFQQFAVGLASGTDDTLAEAIAIARAGVDELATAAAVGNRINEVGAWWQGKLRRKAILASAGRLLITPVGRYELEVAAAEMRLLGEPPWSHDDRLLSAFELAHSELRDHVATQWSDLHRRTRAMLEEAHHNRRQRAVRRRQPTTRSTKQNPVADTIELR